MFGYYIDLALRSLKRNKVLTALMVLALALGIGASITTLTVLRLLSGDPLPQKSAQLFYPQIDPFPLEGYVAGQTKPATVLTYIDAMALMHARPDIQQTVLAMTQAKIAPLHTGERPFFSDGVMATSAFFTMFDAPFQFGGGWSAADEESRAHVAVIADYLNDQLFHGENSVGRIVKVNDHDYRIVGVLKHWAPQPRFYTQELGKRDYGDGEAIFMPLHSARADDMAPGSMNCYMDTNIDKLDTAPCMWLGMWVELHSATEVANYKAFLSHYVQQQIATGRFQRPEVALLDLMGWLRDRQVVPDDVRLQAQMAFGFLLICVLNTVGLLLAKCLRRSQEIGVRRALGATRRTIFAQFMVEAALVGLAGGVLGLAFAELGLWGIRQQPAQYAFLAHLDLQMFLLTFIVALIASVLAGVLPAWRACVLPPAPQLKSA